MEGTGRWSNCSAIRSARETGGEPPSRSRFSAATGGGHQVARRGQVARARRRAWSPAWSQSGIRPSARRSGSEGWQEVRSPRAQAFSSVDNALRGLREDPRLASAERNPVGLGSDRGGGDLPWCRRGRHARGKVASGRISARSGDLTRLIVVFAALIAVLCPGTAFAQTTVVVTRFDDPPQDELRPQRLLAPPGGLEDRSGRRGHPAVRGAGLRAHQRARHRHPHDDPRTERRVGNDPPRRLRDRRSRHLGRGGPQRRDASPPRDRRPKRRRGRRHRGQHRGHVEPGRQRDRRQPRNQRRRHMERREGQPRRARPSPATRRPGTAPAIRAAAGGSSSWARGS